MLTHNFTSKHRQPNNYYSYDTKGLVCMNQCVSG